MFFDLKHNCHCVFDSIQKLPKNIRRLAANVADGGWSGAGTWMYLSSNLVSLSPTDCRNIDILFDHRGLQSERFEMIRSDT